jgi:predicted DNA-binding protein (UPF0251 family)
VSDFDWKVIGEYRGDPNVLTIVSHAARRVWIKYKEYTEFEDLRQEAFILATTKDEHLRATESEDYGYLQHQLELDLMNHCELAFHAPWNNPDGTVQRPDHTAIIREGRWEGEGDDKRAIPLAHSYEVLTSEEDGEDSTYISSHVIIETASNDYTRESVESLLPAVWDEGYAYGMPQRDNAPDPDMPKGSANKARGNNLSAYIADIKTGWEKTPLTLKERRALLLAFGLGWTHEEIAHNQEITRRGLSQRVETAVGKIVAHLNGGYYYDPEEAVA